MKTSISRVIGTSVACLAVVMVAGCGLRLETLLSERQARADSRVEALLLVMSNSLLYDAVGVSEILESHPDSHEQLALTLGRVGDERAIPVLEGLLRDSRPEVRRRAAFALGLVRSQAAAPALAAATVDDDRETGLRAVEALARIGEPFDRWSAALLSLPRDEWGERLLPSLFRLPPSVVDGFVDLDTEELTPGGARWLVYAAARSGGPIWVPLLRDRLEDGDGWVRAWAARGLGRLGTAQDLDLLRPLLEDSQASPVIQALRAGARLADEGRAAAPDEWTAALELLLRDPRTGVRLTALEVAGAWLPHPGLAPQLEAAFAEGTLRERQLALLAMARARTVGAEVRALHLALSPEPLLRAVAAEAAVTLGLVEALEVLFRDPSPAVRLAALTGLLAHDGESRAATVRMALSDRDVAVRAAVLEWLAGSPIVGIEEILAAMRGVGSKRFPALAVNGVLALEARHAEALERGAVVAALEELGRDREFLVRRAAAEALERLGRPRPAIGWIVTDLGLDVYRGMVERSRGERYVVLEIESGSLTLQLECGEAPLTCSSFMQLVNQGFYDGLRFHRVIPDFVAQGGDPRGDGWGGPGYTLRDESTRIDFERGVIGMARSDRHTAGSQFFVTLSAQPHLNGEYTAFGRVTEGENLLDEIVQGDEIISMRELRAASGLSLR